MEIRRCAGIDLGEKHNVYCVIDPARAKPVRRGKVPNTEAGYVRLVRELTDASDPATGELPTVAVESERGLLPLSLRRDGFDVYFVSPLRTASLRQALGMGTDKDDQRDAEAIANALRINAARTPQMKGVSDHIRALQATSRAYAFAQERAEMAAGTLRSHTNEYWPAFTAKYDSTELRKMPWVRAALSAYPTPTLLAEAPEEALRRVLVGAGRSRSIDRSIAQDLRPLAQDSVLRYPPTIETQFSHVTGMLVANVDAAVATADLLLDRLTDLYLAHPLSLFFDSLPGVGLLTGVRMLSEVGDDPFRFSTVEGLQGYGGCRPGHDASGTRNTVTRRYHRNVHLQTAVTQWAGQLAITRRGDNPPISPGAARLYQAQSSRQGKSINHAHRVVGGRLLAGIWHSLTWSARFPQDNRPWDPWDDAKVFPRQYEQLRSAATPAGPAQNKNPHDAPHRRGRTLHTLHELTEDASRDLALADLSTYA